MKPYFLFYNVLNVLGWSYVLINTLTSKLNNDTPLELWGKIGTALTYTQTLAGMEILHSLFGLVRSPLMGTFIQVMSRLLIIWCYMVPAEACHEHWSLYLMVLSWCFIEVVRYSFYAWNIVVDGNVQKVPYTLFWLRYNLFQILYPTGITGELVQMYVAMPYILKTNPVGFRLALAHYGLYTIFSPFVMFNMFNMRNRATKKLNNAKKGPRPIQGVSWPITNAKGDRSTTVTNRAIWEASFNAVDEDKGNEVSKVKNWRFGYVKYVQQNVRLACESKENALKIANAGLDKSMEKFQFVPSKIQGGGNEPMTLQEAMDKFQGKEEYTFDTYVLKGEKSFKQRSLQVPYCGKSGAPYYLFDPEKNKTSLEGEGLIKQLQQWASYGTIEQSAADAIKKVVENREWLDLRNKYFVLLGATSAMGPLEILLKHGANIIAVDLDRDFIWKKLIKKARNSCGTLYIPVKRGAKESMQAKEKTDAFYDELSKVSGCDLLCATPLIRNWIVDVHKNYLNGNEKLVIGNYTYLDGALHVQLSVACNAIIKGVASQLRSPNQLAIAFLCTPTDVHVIPQEASQASAENLSNAPIWQKIASMLGVFGLRKNKLQPVENTDYTGKHIYLVDGTVSAQGPNYSLAKRLQHWMAITMRENGYTVASNVAPSTATLSVIHAWTFKAAYGGMHHFKPMEVMYQGTSNAVMGALLIHDIQNENSHANPRAKLQNPMELFRYGSFHGGIWRTGYALDSTSVVCVLAYLATNHWFSVSAGMGLFTSFMYYVVTGEIGGVDPASTITNHFM